MDLVIDGKRVRLDPKNALGAGGEATVTRHGSLAVKVYHQPTPLRGEKLRAMVSTISPKLPPEVVAPLSVVTDAKSGAIVGFTMQALDSGYDVVASLAKRSHRAKTKIGTAGVASLFETGHKTLCSIHSTGMVVGDFNDQNELYSARDLKLAWIDVDSFQIPGYTCDVATETFLDPKLYGPDITCPVATLGGKPRVFAPTNDWYSYAVMLFRSLTLVHPYGGVDLTLTTLPKRAQARKSVFSKGVAYPAKIGYALEVLSDELSTYMQGTFEKPGYAYTVFPLILLERYRLSLIPCKSCGAEYPSERRRCPSCAAKSPVAPLVTTKVECTATDIIDADGDILALCASGTLLRALAIEGGSIWLYELNNHSTTRTMVCPASPLMDVDLGPVHVGVVHRQDNPADLHVRLSVGQKDLVTLPTERFGGGKAAFAVGATHFYRFAKGMLLRCDGDSSNTIKEQPVTTGAIDQTWVAAGKQMTSKGEVVLGCSRNFNDRRYWLVTGSGRTDLEAKALEVPGTVTEETVLFSDRLVAILRLVSVKGVEYVSTVVVDLDGEVVVTYMQRVSDRIAGSTIHGGAFAGKNMIFATDHGLVREKFGVRSDANPIEVKFFNATEPFVASDSSITPFRDGLAVAHGNKVRLLKM